MRLRRLEIALATVLLAAWVGRPALAADDVLDVVPDNVLGVVTVKNLEEANRKLAQVSERLGVPAPNLLELAKQRSGLDAGVDLQGSVALAAIQADCLVLFVATTDFDALLKPLNPVRQDDGLTRVQAKDRVYLAAKKGGYALFAEESAAEGIRAVLASERSLAEKVKPLQAWLDAQQIRAVLTPGGVRFVQQQLLDGIAKLKQGFAEATKQAGNQGGQPSPTKEQLEATLAGFKVYEILFEAMDEELSHVAIGLRIEDQGAIHLASRSLLADGGVLAQLSQKEVSPRPARTAMQPLPPGDLFLAFAGPLPQGWMRPMMELSTEVMYFPGKKELSEADRKRLVELSVASSKRVRAMSMSMGVPGLEEPLYGRTLIVVKVQDSAAYLSDYRQSLAEMAKLGQQADAKLFDFDVEEIDIAGKPGFKMTMDMASLLGEQQVPQGKQMMELMFGAGGKAVVYFTVADERTVLGSYVSADMLPAAMKRVSDGGTNLLQDPLIAATTRLFPEGAQWIGYFSPSGMMQFIRRTLVALAPNVPAQIPEIAATPPIGFAVKLEPGISETDLVIPPELLTAGAGLVREAMQQRQAR